MKYPYGLAFSLGGATQQGDHLLYVCEHGNNRIQVLNSRTGAHVGFLGEGALKNPRGLKIHAGAEGKALLFVSDHGNSRIQVLEA